MKLAFKATNYNFECQGNTKFELYKIYEKPEKETIHMCSPDGFHYCVDIKNLHEFYPFNRDNRYFIIEVLGNHTGDSIKSITTKFRFLKEITEKVSTFINLNKISYLSNEYFLKDFIYPHKEIEEIEYKEKFRNEVIKELEQKRKIELDNKQEEEAIRENCFKKALHLELVKQIQIDFPLSIIGGSVALFLHGIRLNRWTIGNKPRDIDIIVPYYIPFDKLSNGGKFEICEEDTPSMSDFTDRLTIDGVKVDICISPKTKWEYIEYEGFTYRVNNLQEIWGAKIKYNKRKHIEDLKEAMITTKSVKSLTK